MKTIYLHIGPHKTATSSIQSGLKQARNLLFDNGINFPLLPGPDLVPDHNHSALFYSLFCDHPENYHMNRRAGIATSHSAQRLNQEYRRTLIAELTRTDTETLLFSGEDIVLLSNGELARLKSFFSSQAGDDCAIEVICYVRSPIDWYSSLVQQWVRGGACLEDAVETPCPSLKALLQNFVDHFGPDNITIRKYEEAIAHKNGPAGHFLQSVLGLVDTGPIPRLAENKGLSAEAVYLVSALNKTMRTRGDALPEGVERPYLEPFFSIDGARFVIPRERQEAVWSSFQEDLAWIASVFGISTYANPGYREPNAQLWGDDAILSLAKLVAGER